jgi:transcriptional regulator with XRE-family HTH domain
MAMIDLVDEIEVRRQALRLSQHDVAARIGVSQGQYSKLIKGKVPLTPKMAARMAGWLAGTGALDKDDAQEILDKCIELMHLLQRYVDAGAVAATNGK